MEAYGTRCSDCGGPLPEQRIGNPRKRCRACADVQRLRLQRERTAKIAREVLALPPRVCLICNGAIKRVVGGRGRDKYCSRACAHEAALRFQRRNRGGLKHPASVVRAALNSPRVLVSGTPPPYQVIAQQTRREVRSVVGRAEIEKVSRQAIVLVGDLDMLLTGINHAVHRQARGGDVRSRIAQAQLTAAEIDRVLSALGPQAALRVVSG